jgi:glycine oxidase
VNRDIIVIGAGVVGCATGYELARRGASVELLDERPVGQGATQASAGILAPYIEARETSPLLALTVRSLGLFDEFVARVTADSGRTVTYRRTGTLNVAVDPDDLDKLQKTAEVLDARAVQAELLGAAATREQEPLLAEDVLGALLITTHGFVAASDLTRALATAAERHGAHVAEPCRVRRIDATNDAFVIETDAGIHSAHGVVLAAGCWSGTVEVAGVTSRVPVRPVRGQLLHLGWSGPPLCRVTWGARCYLVPWEDDTVLVGATVEEAGFDERATVAGVRDLLEAACDLVPCAWAAGFQGARVGLRPATPDDLPVIGASSRHPRLMYATGHYRNGVLLAPLTAQLVADAMLDQRTDPLLDTVSPARFGL